MKTVFGEISPEDVAAWRAVFDEDMARWKREREANILAMSLATGIPVDAIRADLEKKPPRERAYTLIAKEVEITLPATVRLRQQDAPAFKTYPYEAEGRIGIHRHIAFGETPEQAVANLRDWMLGRIEHGDPVTT